MRAWLPLLVLALGADPAASAPTLVRRLENGLQVAVFRDARLPVVQVQVVVPAGTRDEGPLEAGAARLTALLLTRGTSSRPAVEYASEVERLGGSVAGHATADYAGLGGAFRAADLARGLELIADAAINPIFDEVEVRGAQREILRALVESRGHLGLVAGEHLWARAWQGHPYAVPELATPEMVAALTRERILGFHRARYRPDRALLGIAGDVDPERALALAQEHFGSWGGRVRGEVAARPPAPPAASGILLVDAPGSAEAEIRIGLVVPGRAHDDAAALGVVNDLLGGAPGSRLAPGSERVLRAYSTLQLYEDGGLLALGTVAENDSVPAAVERLRSELARLGSAPPTEAEVERARRVLARSFPIQNEPLGARTLLWLVGELLGLGPDYPERHRRRLEAVSPADVRGAVGRWLAPARSLVVVVVGAAGELRAGLEELGPVEEVAIQSAPVAAAVTATMRTDEPDAAALERGRRLVGKLLAAHGGLARLKGIRDSRVEGEVTLHSGGQSVTGRQVELRREPGGLRIENLFPELASVQGLEGDQAWTRVAAGERDSVQVEDAETVAGLKHAFAGDLPHLLLAAADPRSRVAHRGRDESESSLEVIEVVDSAGVRRVLLVDAARHRLVAAEENQGSVLRGPVLRRRFGDFREVKGILWPHSEERFLNGVRTMTIAVARVDLNAGVGPEAFRKPGDSAATRRPRR
jgi:predicted Zn-dependent peptidase